jgi:hypothetical protein
MISDINVSRPAEMRSASTRERRRRHDCGSFILYINLTTVGGSTQGLEWAVARTLFVLQRRAQALEHADMMAEISSSSCGV